MFASKLFVLFATVFAVAHAAPTKEQMEKLREMMISCKSQTGATDADLSQLLKHEIPDNRAGICFAACMQKGIGILTADNKMDVTRLGEVAASLKEKSADKYDKVITIAKTCAAEVTPGNDECEVSRMIMECCRRESSAIGLEVNILEIIA